MPDYKEDIFNKPKMNSHFKTVKNIDEYEDALNESNVNGKKLMQVKKVQIKW